MVILEESAHHQKHTRLELTPQQDAQNNVRRSKEHHFASQTRQIKVWIPSNDRSARPLSCPWRWPRCTSLAIEHRQAGLGCEEGQPLARHGHLQRPRHHVLIYQSIPRTQEHIQGKAMEAPDEEPKRISGPRSSTLSLSVVMMCILRWAGAGEGVVEEGRKAEAKNNAGRSVRNSLAWQRCSRVPLFAMLLAEPVEKKD